MMICYDYDDEEEADENDDNGNECDDNNCKDIIMVMLMIMMAMIRMLRRRVRKGKMKSRYIIFTRWSKRSLMEIQPRGLFSHSVAYFPQQRNGATSRDRFVTDFPDKWK